MFAPISGKVAQLADTIHAVDSEADGMESLIHVGIDTVDMEGRRFSYKVKVDQSVEKGQELLTMDQVRAAGHPTATIVEEVASGRVSVLRVSKLMIPTKSANPCK